MDDDIDVETISRIGSDISVVNKLIKTTGSPKSSDIASVPNQIDKSLKDRKATKRNATGSSNLSKPKKVKSSVNASTASQNESSGSTKLSKPKKVKSSVNASIASQIESSGSTSTNLTKLSVIGRKVTKRNATGSSNLSKPKKVKSSVNASTASQNESSGSTKLSKPKKVKSSVNASIASQIESSGSTSTNLTKLSVIGRKVTKRNATGSSNLSKLKKVKLSVNASTASQIESSGSTSTNLTKLSVIDRKVTKRNATGSSNLSKPKKAKSSVNASAASQIESSFIASLTTLKKIKPSVVASTASEIESSGSTNLIKPNVSTASQIESSVKPSVVASTAVNHMIELHESCTSSETKTLSTDESNSKTNKKRQSTVLNESIERHQSSSNKPEQKTLSQSSSHNNEVIYESNSETFEDDSNRTIANYSSSGNDTSLVNIIPRKRKEDRQWMRVNDFVTLEDAILEVKKEAVWTKCSSSQNVILFRCNRVKLKGEQCQSGLRILLSKTDLSATLYKSLRTHNCDTILSKSTKFAMTDELKVFIKKLFMDGFKRRKIEDEIIAAKKPLPSKLQLTNFISSLRKESHGRPTLNVAQLDEILKKHFETPQGENTGFVINYDIKTEAEIRFNFFVSSKKLLSNAVRSSIWCGDTTYKLLWQGFPVEVVGSIDGAKQFHPTGIAVSCNEETEDFKFLFSALKNGIKQHLNIDMCPQFIMSDAAKPIPNAFRLVYGDDVIELMCRFHMKTATKMKIETLIPKEERDEILNDVDKLQLSQNSDIFDKASKLFLEKHKKHNEFIEYFEQQWLKLHRNWYEGAGGFKVPSTNNALETFNRIIKQERTLRERLSLQHFIDQLFTWIEIWGNRYDAGSKVFLTNPTIDLPLLTKSYQWTRLNKIIKKHLSGHFLMVPAGDKIDLSEWYKIYTWDTFDQFKENAFKGYGTIVPDNEKWIEGTCTCPAFYKEFICKHIVGIAIRMKNLEVPITAKQITIGSKRGRGRPSKAKRALLKQ